MSFTRNIALERATLSALIERLGLPTTLLSLLLAHARSVERDSERLGLVSPGDSQHIVSRHTADSLLFAVARAPAAGERWIDVGSGAGFPGLVLAASYPNTGFTLLEPLQRRAGFLELIAADLGLANTTVEVGRLEQVEGAAFDVAVARALSEPGAALTSMRRVLRPGGEAIVATVQQGPGVAGATVVTLTDLGNVDSPGVFFMMSSRG